MKTQLKRIDGTLIDESDTLTLKELVVKNKHRLQNADMRDADMRGADMQNADMQNADMRGADMRDANMQHAYMWDANMRGANMRDANMRGADMQNADMQHAHMRGADLRGADIDYSAWPLWCGTYNVKVDKRIAAQIAMHFCWLDCDDPEVKAAQEAIKSLAMKCRHWKERE